jgi:hypothetical protein
MNGTKAAQAAFASLIRQPYRDETDYFWVQNP